MKWEIESLVFKQVKNRKQKSTKKINKIINGVNRKINI